MKNKIKDNKGITLVTLVITIVILIILASIGTYSGIEVIKSSKFTRFQTELKIMQAKTNEWYDEYKDDVDNSRIISELGATATLPNDASIAFLGAGKTNDGGYLFFSESTIENLDLNEIYEEFLINIKKREVISYKGFEYQGNKYYTLEQIPDSLYNVEHDNKNTWNSEIDSFDVNYTELGEGKYRIDVSNIDYKSGNINKWQVKYKKENENDWKQANNYSFIIDEVGNYRVKIANNNTESNEKQIKAKSSLLPSEFQEVEYIESTGTQYIDTDIFAKTEKYKVVYDMKASEQSYGFIGANGILQLLLNQGKYYVNTANSTSISTKDRHTLISEGEIVNGHTNTKLTIDDTIVSVSWGNEYYGNILLFALGDHENVYNNAKISGIDMYDCKIYENNVLIRNFIPCYSTTTATDIDGEEYPKDTIGMYDIVNNRFYVNKGSGTFIKGNDIDSGETIKAIIINNV